MLPPARPGMALADIDTPSLVIDLDAFERNLDRMARYIAGSKASLRAHSKTHKSPIIARQQIERGAVGVCCQKVSEAEIMVQGGIKSVLVSNEVVGQRKLERLAALARVADVAFCIDTAENVRQANDVAKRFGVQLNALVEIDVGAGRCGAAPGAPAARLASLVAEAPSLRFKGLQAYYGAAQHVRDPEDRRAAIERAIHLTEQTIEMLHQKALACEIVGGAGTGTFDIEGESGVYNELQAGSYVFMDADYARNESADGSPFGEFEHALFVCATVMSRPTDQRAIVDAGLKALAVDSGMPIVHELPTAEYTKASDEHGVLALEGANAPPVYGEKILFIPGHCDPTVNLYDTYVCVRGLGTANAFVEALWPVAARGAVY